MGTSSKVNGRTIKYNYFLYTGQRLWGIHPRGCAKSIRTQGDYILVNGGKYEGYWKDDLLDGYGVETW